MQGFRHAWLALGCLWVAAIAYLSLASAPQHVIEFEHADKLEHVLAYGLLMLWFSPAFHTSAQRMLLAVLLAGMGGAIEYVQGAMGYRVFDYADMLANGAGVIFGWVLAQTLLQRMLALLEARIIAG